MFRFLIARPWRMNRIAALFVIAVALTGRGRAADRIDFNRDVRPILSAKCFACHGPDAESRQAELRLDTREGLLADRGGYAAFVPGDLKKSEAIQRILSDDIFTKMPPVDSGETLTAEEKQILTQWVLQGAKWEAHWAFIPPKRHDPPAVKNSDWPRNAIDRFVLSRLEAKGWTPAKPANRYALIRRVSLDLVGLPPTPAEVDAFVNDDRPDAYARLVDRLLASPHYGERWARRWLDLARYADTNGYEKDRPREIWAYRDWVIDAFNADMPFDEFTVKQLAGDMLPNATLADRIATGFHRNTMLNEEGGIDPLEFRFHAMTDRVGTTGTTWLGLTVRCAQCHDHKYDPISHREYYGMMAFLNNADQPELTLPAPELDAQYAADLARAKTLIEKLPSQWPLPDDWQAATILEATTASSEAPQHLPDGSLLFAAPGPAVDSYTLVVETEETTIGELRLAALADKRLPSGGPGRVGHGNFVLSEIRIQAAPRNQPAALQPVEIATASAAVEQAGYPAAAAIDGNEKTGWAVHRPGKPLNVDQFLTLQFKKPVAMPEGARFIITLEQQHGNRHTIGRVRVDLPRDQKSLKNPETLAQESFQTWLKKERVRTVDWKSLRPNEMSSNLPLLTLQKDDSIFVTGDTTKQDTYHLTLPTNGQSVRAIRLEALPDPRLPEGGPGMTYYEGPRGDFFLNEFQLTANGKPVKIASATHSYANNRYRGEASASLSIDGDHQTGWSIDGRQGERHQVVYLLAEPLKTEELQLEMTFGRHYASSLGRFRISIANREEAIARDLPREVEALLAETPGEINDQEQQRLFEAFLLHAPQLAKQTKQIRELQSPPDYPTTLVFRERPPENPRPTFMHIRGEYLQPGEKVEPMTIQALHPFPDDLPRNRLGFAKWLVMDENPLTARVVVNRHWAALFGRGIVPTVQDFGFQGEPPSHPALLDWLALQFQERGWSVKDLHRQIVMSATYRQSSRVSPDEYARDPMNVYLSRAPRLRLKAELIRDSALAASGLLVPEIGGPPVKPPQPAGVTEAAYGSPSWNASEGADRYRRSIYTYIKRTAPFAMYAVFDAPSGEACIAQRDVSNTSLQALTLVNDEMFVEIARAMGRRLAKQNGTDAQRARNAFRSVLARPPKQTELDRLLMFVKDQRERFASGELNPQILAKDKTKQAVEIATWTALARGILSLDEAITRP